jgi:ADP-heptose:LPS heptosyltransferase
VVCSLPAASALKQAFPDSHVTWVVDPRFAAIVECCSAVDEVVATKIGFSLSTWPRFTERFDFALDLQGLLKSAVPVAASKAATKLGYHWQREGSWLFSRRVIPDPSSFHIVDQYVDVARAAGGVADRAEFNLTPKAADLQNVRKKLASAGVEGGFIAINAGAAWASKRWPMESFATVIDQARLPSVLIGTPSDVPANEELASLCSRKPASLVGQTSVGDLVALLSLCSAHVGGDTGSTHIAAALDRPAIGLYSITRPNRSCPYGQIDNCFYNMKSLADIPAAAVSAKLQQVLS